MIPPCQSAATRTSKRFVVSPAVVFSAVDDVAEDAVAAVAIVGIGCFCCPDDDDVSSMTTLGNGAKMAAVTTASCAVQDIIKCKTVICYLHSDNMLY